MTRVMIGQSLSQQSTLRCPLAWKSLAVIWQCMSVRNCFKGSYLMKNFLYGPDHASKTSGALSIQ